MSLDKVIHSITVTDENEEIFYHNTGRDNVSGLYYPDNYIRNIDNYLYTRILNIKLSTDTSLIYPIHETFLLTTLKNDNTPGVTNIITLDAIAMKGTVSEKNIKLTCTPLNDSKTISGDIHDIRAVIKNVLDDDGNTNKYLGIWLYTGNIIDIIIKELNSISFNSIPNNIYHQFLRCDYEAYYLNNEDIVYEVNMYNYEESTGTIICNAVHSNKQLIDTVKTLNNEANSSKSDYRFVSVLFNDLYSINNINTDEIITPQTLQYAEYNEPFIGIRDNYVHAVQEGNYLIGLKINMDINGGNSTTMKMSVFLNDDRIDETTTTIFIDPNNKVYPLGYLAGQVKLKLKPSDKLYLKARWSNKDDVHIENHCSLQITMLDTILQ